VVAVVTLVSHDRRRDRNATIIIIIKEFFGCIMYADDLILLSPSVDGLQHMLNICDLFACSNSSVFNIKKTCCAAIGRCRCLDAKFFLDNQVIPWSDVFKYIGVHFICGNIALKLMSSR